MTAPTLLRAADDRPYPFYGRPVTAPIGTASFFKRLAEPSAAHSAPSVSASAQRKIRSFRQGKKAPSPRSGKKELENEIEFEFEIEYKIELE